MGLSQQAQAAIGVGQLWIGPGAGAHGLANTWKPGAANWGGDPIP